MNIKLHKQATTTPKIRAEIQQAPASISDLALARKYGVSDSTIRRWRYRTDVYDRSHTRHNLLATLSPHCTRTHAEKKAGAHLGAAAKTRSRE